MPSNPHTNCEKYLHEELTALSHCFVFVSFFFFFSKKKLQRKLTGAFRVGGNSIAFWLKYCLNKVLLFWGICEGLNLFVLKSFVCVIALLGYSGMIGRGGWG